MQNKAIERALVCRIIDQYMNQHGLTGPLTDEHLVQSALYVLELLTSFEVRAMYDENTFRKVDVEGTELFELYTQRLAERFAGARLDKHVDRRDPLTEEHLRDLIGDFQDLIWNGYGDNAIQVD